MPFAELKHRGDAIPIDPATKSSQKQTKKQKKYKKHKYDWKSNAKRERRNQDAATAGDASVKAGNGKKLLTIDNG